MYNVLIAGDNVTELHILINCIFKEIYDIRLLNVALTEKEFINILEERTVDLIIVNFKDKNCIERCINYLSIEKLDLYKNSIIICTKEDDTCLKYQKNLLVHNCINKNRNFETKLIKNIYKLLFDKINNKEVNSLYNKIFKELGKLKFDLSQLGTKYLIECIIEIYNLKEYDNINLSKNIYPIIAKRHNKSVNNIKTNVVVSMM